jgi:hypothetical protein
MAHSRYFFDLFVAEFSMQWKTVNEILLWSMSPAVLSPIGPFNVAPGHEQVGTRPGIVRGIVGFLAKGS